MYYGVVHSFQGEFRFLSNFHPSPVWMYGLEYPTVEHAYQAAKTLDRAERERIRTAHTPGVAKRLGRVVKIRDDWNEFRLVAMEELLRRKFTTPQLNDQLLATGNKLLVEGNTWGDEFWGVCDSVGENHLGRLLMKIREELVQEDEWHQQQSSEIHAENAWLRAAEAGSPADWAEEQREREMEAFYS